MSTKKSTRSVTYREIPEFPGFRFGSDGSAWNRFGRGRRTPSGEWRQLTPSRRPTGLLWLYLGPRTTTKPVRLDELVCQAWNGPRPAGAECVHADGNRSNCQAGNLSWGESIENLRNPSIEYRRVPECEGYEFGADGSIWSCWGIGFAESPSGIWRRMHPNRLKNGRLQVTVKWKGKMRRFGVHHLLCIVFYGRRPRKMECRHLDGNPANNVISNLRWSIRKDNTQDQIRHGTITRGEQHGSAKLTDDQIREIRRHHAKRVESINATAKRFGVSWITIDKILRRQTWKHVV